VLLERSESSTTAAPNAENDYANGPSSSDLFVARIHRRKCTVAGLHGSALAGSTAVEVVMPTYRVELAQTVIERATVWIEANTADEAERLALAESAIGWAEFRFADSAGDIEVIGVEKKL
jgi:hypothetical protein